MSSQGANSHEYVNPSERLAALLQSVDFDGVSLRLYDVDLPGRKGGTLRIYIVRVAQASNSAVPAAATEPAEHKNTASIEDCARVSRFLLENPLFEELFPGECLLEVSSPGVNRRLRTCEHFKGAIGERVRLLVDGQHVPPAPVRSRVNVVGVVLSCSEDALVLRREPADRKEKRKARKLASADAQATCEQLSLPLHAISEARVDFLFV